MSDLLADYEPRFERHNYDPEINPQFAEDPPHILSFTCPTCGKHRWDIPVRSNHHQGYWLVHGQLPAISVHPSFWGHAHAVWNEEKGDFDVIKCEWHDVIFKGRFLHELFAWPVEDPANAKFG